MLFLFRVLTITSDSEDEIPLLTNHHALQRLALLGPSKDVLSVLARLPLLALSSIVSASPVPFFAGTNLVLPRSPKAN